MKAQTSSERSGVLLWHADLAHGGLPISAEKTRASIATHTCPEEVGRLTVEHGRTAVQPHKDALWSETRHDGEDAYA